MRVAIPPTAKRLHEVVLSQG